MKRMNNSQDRNKNKRGRNSYNNSTHSPYNGRNSGRDNPINSNISRDIRDLKNIKVELPDNSIFSISIPSDCSFEELRHLIRSKLNSSLEGPTIDNDNLVLKYKDDDDYITLTETDDVKEMMEEDNPTMKVLYRNNKRNIFHETKNTEEMEEDNSDEDENGDDVVSAVDFLISTVYSYNPKKDDDDIKIWIFYHFNNLDFVYDYLEECFYTPKKFKYYIMLYDILYTELYYDKMDYDNQLLYYFCDEVNNFKTAVNYYNILIEEISKNKSNIYLLKNLYMFCNFVVNISKGIKSKMSLFSGKIIKQSFEILDSIQIKNEYKRTIELFKIAINLNIEEEAYLIQNIPIIPTKDEICVDDDKSKNEKEDKFVDKLIKNKNEYKSFDEYIYVHYTLLRADMILPLRKAIEIAKRKKDEKVEKVDKFNVECYLYNKVNLVEFNVDREAGILYVIEFDLPKEVKNWKYTKRLQYGTLVCLSSDNFDNFFWAVVVEHNDNFKKHQPRPRLCIELLSDNSNVQIKLGVNYIMAEAPSIFFDSYKHTLKSLLDKKKDSFPFQDYLLFKNRTFKPPSYVDKNTQYIMREVFPSHPKFNILGKWPETSDILEKHQLEALKNILTKEISLIQGPPGTGKTYVGSHAVKILLQNEQYYTGPILVVCYTNHALDQFLESFIEDCKPGDLIRIGGRSKSEKLENFSLYKLRDNDQKQSKITNSTDKKDEVNLSREYNAIQIGFSKVFPRVQDFQQSIRKSLTLKFLYNSNIVNLSDYNELTYNRNNDKLPYIDYNTFKIIKERKIKYNKQSIRDNFTKNNRFDDDDKYSDHLSPKDQLFKWRNELKLKQGKTNKENDEIENKLFIEWFNEIHKNIQITNDNIDNLYNEYQKCIGSYVEIYREYFHKYMTLKTNKSRLWSMTQYERDYKYSGWEKEYYDKIYNKFDYDLKEYNEISKRYDTYKINHDVYLLKKAKIIGMTITGASRLIELISKLQCSIMVVEEAGEVLESHIMSILNENIKHLILIGDHMQLKPTIATFQLEVEKNLTVSMFERLVKNNKSEMVQLKEQHRMRKEVCDLIRPLYVDLKDHENVYKYETIRGVKYPVFFFNHYNPEMQSSDDKEKSKESQSKKNYFESKMIVHFIKYLMQNGYEGKDITVLSFYLGQCELISEDVKELLGEEKSKEIKIISVDNFQGEENEIIIFSAVRCNENNRIGFCRVVNRVNVALSRAKKGLFMFGNEECLRNGCHNKSYFKETNFWDEIFDYLHENKFIGDSLFLCCENHPDNMILIKTPEEFQKKCPEGGCTLMCNKPMKCGHYCKHKCHSGDCESKGCTEVCNKIIDRCGHTCIKACGEPCEPCTHPVEIMLQCRHTMTVPCIKRDSIHNCEKPCNKTYPCGHKCQKKCCEPCCSYCTVKVPKKLPCGHTVETECGGKQSEVQCNHPCDVKLECGHPCKGTCYSCFKGKIHIPCRENCQNLLICGHKCKSACGEVCCPCNEKCQVKCSHSECKESCGKPCYLCNEKCNRQCKHGRCTKLCKEECNYECNKKCDKLLECKHYCIGVCGEKCSRLCRICNKDKVEEIFFGTEDNPDALFVELPECQHIFEISGMDKYINDFISKSKDDYQRRIEYPPCPRCKTPIITCERYHTLLNEIHMDVEKIKNIRIDEIMKINEAAKQNINVGLPTDDEFKPFERIIEKINNDIDLIWNIMLNDNPDYDLIYRNYYYSVSYSDLLRIFRRLTQVAKPFIDFLILRYESKIIGKSFNDVFFNICGMTFLNEAMSIEEVKKCKDYEKYLRIIKSGNMTNDKIEEILKELNKIQSLEVEEFTKKCLIKNFNYFFKCPEGHIVAIGECSVGKYECPQCKKIMIGFDIETGKEKEFNLAECILANYDKFRLMYFLFYTSASIGKLELVAPSNIGSEEFKNKTKSESQKSKQKSLEILEKLPVSDRILDWCKKGNDKLKQELNFLHPMSYNLLSWCMTYQSNHIIELKGKSAIPNCNATYQFLIRDNERDKVLKSKETDLLFHGSGIGCWFSIIKDGFLESGSAEGNEKLGGTTAAYGQGVYLGGSFSDSFGYACGYLDKSNINHDTGLGTGCFLTMSLVELPYGKAQKTRHEGYFTAKKEFCCIRLLLIYKGSSSNEILRINSGREADRKEILQYIKHLFNNN